MPNPVLQAAYAAPGHASFTASQPLPPVPAPAATHSDAKAKPAAADTAAYLVTLRAAVAAVQAEVNRELTARMVLDVQAAGAAAAAADREEENYGEEVVAED